MSTVKEKLEELQTINGRYELPVDNIIKYLDDMDKDLLCIPVIGAFSSGKSAAINTLLGYSRKILMEDITPETAIPAEIQYPFDSKSKDSVEIIYVDGKNEIRSLVEYVETTRDNLNAEDVERVRFYLDNEFIKSIPQVMLVDLPGFGSGNDIHDKAINNYAGNSMAYIVTFPADDMILREEVGNVLKELIGLNKPICVMITKVDKAPPQEDYEATWRLLEKNLRKYIGDREFSIIETSSKDGDVEQLKKYLHEMQEQSIQLIDQHGVQSVFEPEVGKTRLYLRGLLEKSDLSESELKEQEELINSEMQNLIKKTSELTSTFRNETQQCVQEIIGDVRIALDREIDNYVLMAMSGDDEESISGSINADVRTTMNESFQRRFLEKAQKYIKNVAAQVEITDSLLIEASTAHNTSGGNVAGGVIGGGAIAGTTMLASGVLAGLGGTATTAATASLVGGSALAAGSLTIPVVGIAVAIGAVIGGLIMKSRQKKKREEMKAQLYRQFQSQVFPSVINQVSPIITKHLNEKTDEISNIIEGDIQNRKAIIEKALEDNRKNQAKEVEALNERKDEISADLERLGEWCHG